tara:strand:- start:278 stop:658 length:381 start_codon:yes stop_codon:yes gene_type:complete
MDYGRKFVKFPNKYSEQNVLNKVFIFENYESAYDLGSDVTHNDAKISDYTFDNGGDSGKILQEGAREVHIGETNGGIDLSIRINSATADKIFVPANNLPYVIDKIDVFDLWITASGAADLNIVCFK